jgi:hypothetical protein
MAYLQFYGFCKNWERLRYCAMIRLDGGTGIEDITCTFDLRASNGLEKLRG